ncbi:MAG: oligosaccharide flippase family protein [Planctomycetes bacterium]|nr:oligosaccharide flippase family protein [Planctomycetota bacterium]
MKLISLTREHISKILPRNSLRRRFAKGAFWSIAATVLAQGLTFVASVVVARLLDPTGFGELEMIRSTVGMFGVFAGLGIGLTATKYIAQFRRSDPVRTGRIIGLLYAIMLISSSVISVAIFAIAPYLAAGPIKAAHLTTELRIGCGLLFFNTLIGAQIGALAGFESFRMVALISLVRGVLTLPLMVIGVLLFGLSGAVSGLVCAVGVSCILAWFILRKETDNAGVRITYRHIGSEFGVLWGFSLPAFFSSAMVGPVRWSANALLVHQASYAELGIFMAATQFQRILEMAGIKIGAALVPILASGDAKKSERFNRGNILISWMIGVGAALPLICFPEMIGLLFGQKYADINAQRTLVMVMCCTCIIMYKQGLSRVLVANGLMWWAVLSNMMWAAVLLTSFWFLRRFGAIGLAGAFVIAYGLNTICFVPLYVFKKLAPKGTLISTRAIVIWLMIILLTCLSMFRYSLLIRAIALAAAIFPLYYSFRDLFLLRKTSSPPDFAANNVTPDD